jgi:hypothetical protein
MRKRPQDNHIEVESQWLAYVSNPLDASNKVGEHTTILPSVVWKRLN